MADVETQVEGRLRVLLQEVEAHAEGTVQAFPEGVADRREADHVVEVELLDLGQTRHDQNADRRPRRPEAEVVIRVAQLQERQIVGFEDPSRQLPGGGLQANGERGCERQAVPSV